jgi:hypothetical protein
MDGMCSVNVFGQLLESLDSPEQEWTQPLAHCYVLLSAFEVKHWSLGQLLALIVTELDHLVSHTVDMRDIDVLIPL